MRYVSFICLWLTSTMLAGQALRDINYAYLYDPEQPFHFSMTVARDSAGLTASWALGLNDPTSQTGDYVIQWETRSSLIDPEPKALGSGSRIVQHIRDEQELTGNLHLAESPPVLVARVIHQPKNQAWLFFARVPDQWPVDSWLRANGKAVPHGYVGTGDTITVFGPGGRRIVSFYNDDFPPGLPAFSERVGAVSPEIRPDSIFSVVPGQSFVVQQPGLYLLQQDTLLARGFAFRAESDYPKLSRIENLAGPLIYITTRQENERLLAAKGEKRTFDRVILGITNDAGRARTLIRNYFRRVELANRYFTSYKEGWKTDRGMVYIIYGPPDDVFLFEDREVWEYDGVQGKETFNFSRSSSVFDPANFVLLRDDKLRERWYQMVDLWRAARW